MPPESVIDPRAGAVPRSAVHGAAAPVVSYDFRRPNKLSRDHARLLQVAFETFARRLTTQLTSGLRQICTVEMGEVSQQSYDEYIAGLPTPTLILPITLPPLAGTATLQFSLPVALVAIDHMLGGPGGTQEARGLTDIETSLLTGLVGQILGVFHYAFEPIADVTPQAGPIEYNPPFVQAASASDTVVVADFRLSIGQESCRLTISLPLSLILPPLNAHRPREIHPVPASSAEGLRVRRALSGVPVDVSIRFRPVSVQSGRLLTLQVGDVLVLDHPVGAPLTVQADGTDIARAVAGKAGKRLAALIVESAPLPSKEHA